MTEYNLRTLPMIGPNTRLDLFGARASWGHPTSALPLNSGRNLMQTLLPEDEYRSTRPAQT